MKAVKVFGKRAIFLTLISILAVGLAYALVNFGTITMPFEILPAPAVMTPDTVAIDIGKMYVGQVKEQSWIDTSADLTVTEVTDITVTLDGLGGHFYWDEGSSVWIRLGDGTTYVVIVTPDTLSQTIQDVAIGDYDIWIQWGIHAKLAGSGEATITLSFPSAE